MKRKMILLTTAVLAVSVLTLAGCSGTSAGTVETAGIAPYETPAVSTEITTVSEEEKYYYIEEFVKKYNSAAESNGTPEVKITLTEKFDPKDEEGGQCNGVYSGNEYYNAPAMTGFTGSGDKDREEPYPTDIVMTWYLSKANSMHITITGGMSYEDYAKISKAAVNAYLPNISDECIESLISSVAEGESGRWHTDGTDMSVQVYQDEEGNQAMSINLNAVELRID